MTLIRPELAAALTRGREVLAAAALALFGLWLLWLGGWLLQAVGGAALLVAAGWGFQAWRRMHFAQDGEAPGIVEVVEGQIGYFGPVTGGAVGLPDLVEIRLLTIRGRRVWRLKQADGQALLIPVEARGAEALFDAFAALPGMDTGELVAALGAGGGPAARGEGRALALAGESRLVWARAGRAVLRS